MERLSTWCSLLTCRASTAPPTSATKSSPASLNSTNNATKKSSLPVDQESNSRSISASTVKTLAFQFGASFEATARRIAERSYRECVLVCFSNTSSAIIDAPQNLQWHVHYCIPSSSFANKYFQKLTSGGVPEAVYSAVSAEGRDIDRSETVELSIGCRGLAQPSRFNAEFFYNRYNVFCFLTPAGEI